MMTSENAPSRRGMTRTMASSSDRSASRASSSAITSVSLLGRTAPPGPDPSGPPAAVGDGHAGRLLATVLEGVQPVEDEVGDLLPRSPDSEDPARLAWMVGVEHVPPGRDGPAAVGGKHGDRSTGPRRPGGCADAPLARLLGSVVRIPGYAVPLGHPSPEAPGTPVFADERGCER